MVEACEQLEYKHKDRVLASHIHGPRWWYVRVFSLTQLHKMLTTINYYTKLLCFSRCQNTRQRASTSQYKSSLTLLSKILFSNTWIEIDNNLLANKSFGCVSYYGHGPWASACLLFSSATPSHDLIFYTRGVFTPKKFKKKKEKKHPWGWVGLHKICRHQVKKTFEVWSQTRSGQAGLHPKKKGMKACSRHLTGPWAFSNLVSSFLFL